MRVQKYVFSSHATRFLIVFFVRVSFFPALCAACHAVASFLRSAPPGESGCGGENKSGSTLGLSARKTYFCRAARCVLSGSPEATGAEWGRAAKELDAGRNRIKKETTMLLPYLEAGRVEAGCDEAGRGCLAGPVFAGAVILPPDYVNELLNDSKQLTEKRRYRLREEIERDALAWAVGVVSVQEIDDINILNASFLAMHRAIDALKVRPQALLIDGNRFRPYSGIPHTTVVKGDGKYMSIAAASVLAKTYRDDYMRRLHEEYPCYHWEANKGYPAPAHREAIRLWGPTPHHRMTFNLLGDGQLELFDTDEMKGRR